MEEGPARDGVTLGEELPKTMRAAVFTAFGGPENIRVEEEWPVPKIKPDQYLLHVHATSVNPVDWKLVEGMLKYIGPNPPHVVGTDVSGVIVAVGQDCTKFKLGDEVYAVLGLLFGTCAEYAAVAESYLAFKPNNLSHEEAATIPLVGLTGYQALLQHIQLKKDQKLLVLGGSGGTGSIAVQIAKHHIGAHVIATCSSRNAEWVHSLGADQVIDYNTEDWGEVLAGEEVDAIYDTVGEPDSWHKAHGVLRSGGHFATIIPSNAKEHSAKEVLKTVGSIVNKKFWQAMGYLKYDIVTTKKNGSDLQKITELIELGLVKPVVGKVYPFDETSNAFAESRAGRVRGKLAISLVPSSPDENAENDSRKARGNASSSSSSSS
ncbi:putative quinone oxidoreductase, NADPH-dependent [Balamuthia mandrillaris]